MHMVTTSGSTGNPFTILQDRGKRFRNTADTIYYAEKTGFKVGHRLYYLRLWDKQYRKSKYLAWMQNMYMQSVDELNDQQIAGLISKLNADKSNKSIMAYVSALHSICKYLDRSGHDLVSSKMISVIAVAEGLNDHVQSRIKKYFGVEALSRYSNSENGIIAQQETPGGDFKINHGSYHVEILDLNEDKAVAPGETGRIVVTDLFNYGLPLYDMTPEM